jgi:KDO2-lipid IV(A) lauroyltransferase
MILRLSYHLIAGLTRMLPLSVQYAIARRCADAYRLAGRRARANVRANLRVALGPDAPESLISQETRAVFRSFGMYLCEFFQHPRMDEHYLAAHVLVQGRENLDAALALGRGVIFCSGHYSNWELGAIVVARLGYPITAVIQPQADPRTNDVFLRSRSVPNLTVAPTQHGAKSALKALRANHTVALMGDRATGGPIVPVTFFGRTTWLPQGPWRIALVSGAALLPTFMSRRADHSFTLHIGAPVAAPAEGSPRERMAALAQGWADSFAARLRADPGQWATFQRVWPEAAAAQSSAPRATDCGETADSPRSCKSAPSPLAGAESSATGGSE